MPYLKKNNGEGIQHIAVGTEQLYDATDAIFENGIRFMPPPPDTYFRLSQTRVKDHREPLDRLKNMESASTGRAFLMAGRQRYCSKHSLKS